MSIKSFVLQFICSGSSILYPNSVNIFLYKKQEFIPPALNNLNPITFLYFDVTVFIYSVSNDLPDIPISLYVLFKYSYFNKWFFLYLYNLYFLNNKIVINKILYI